MLPSDLLTESIGTLIILFLMKEETLRIVSYSLLFIVETVQASTNVLVEEFQTSQIYKKDANTELC